MAQHKSAEKRNRQTARRTAVNRDHTSNIRSLVKAVETAISSGDKAKAMEAFRKAKPAIMSGVGKSILKKATAARKMSRLSARIKAIGSTA